MADNANEIKVKITGDSSGAVGAISRVTSSLKGGVIGTLKGVRNAVAGVMRAFGVFGMAVQGIRALVEGYRKIEAWMHRAARAAAEMRMAEIFKDAATAMDLLISRQKTYNSLLQKELADLQRRNELDNIDRTDKEKREDEQRSIDRANEIAAAPDEKAEREIRRRWKVEDEQIARSRESDRLKRETANENEKAAIYGSKANAAQTAADNADSAAEDLRAEMIRMSPEQKAEAEKKIAALKAKAKALRESAEMLREEEKQAEARAALYEQQRDSIRNAPSVAEAENNAERTKEKREQDKKDFEEQQKKARESDDAAREFVEEARKEEERQKEERQKSIESYYGNLAGQLDNGRPKDRLTAMGLGSGGTVDRTAQEQAQNVKTLVQLVKEEIAAIRANNNGNVAVYAP